MNNKINSKEISRNVNYKPIVPGKIGIIAISPWVDMIKNGDSSITIVDDNLAKSGNEYKYALFKNEILSTKECGFNAIQIVSAYNNVYPLAFQYAQEINLQAIFARYNYNNDLNKILSQINSIINYKNLRAIQIKDEPSWVELQGINESGKLNFKELYNTILTKYPNLMPFFNLSYSYPSYFDSYYSYLEYIQNNYFPPLWSYDFYPIINNGSGVTFESDKFYSLLQDYKKISDLSGRPFWAFCLCTEYSALNYSRPLPTKGHLRLEAFSALAYGAQAIVYWHYAKRVSSNSENFITCPIYVKLKSSTNPLDIYEMVKTELWYNVQTINKEIDTYSYIFYQCNVNAIHNGNNIQLTIGKGPIQKIATSGQGVILSEITNNGKNYLVIVSKDPFTSQNITINYYTDYLSRYSIVPITANINKKPTFPNLYTINVTLEEGGYAILEWKSN